MRRRRYLRHRWDTPISEVSAAAAEANEAWKQAAALEHDGRDLDEAIRAYAAIARSDANRDLRARALVGQARCLAGREAKPEAIRILTSVLIDTAYAGSVDTQGRLIVPNAQLLALQVIHDTADTRYRATAERLAEFLTSYTDCPVGPARRLAYRPPGETDPPQERSTRHRLP